MKGATGMRTVEILERKRDGEPLEEDEIRFLIDGYCEGSIPDYQMASFAMAVVWHGMTFDETLALTKAMIDSGDIIDCRGLGKKSIDKHSTGGVGDKTTLVVAPLVASLGYAVPKLSGRGLGHTGGTLDKLESIPGYRTSIDQDTFLDIVSRIGVAVASPTENIVPADKLLYALRDATATVRSLPLIASSIMSKKLAVATDAISLDVKVGEGAFFRTLDEAREFAHLAIRIGDTMDRRVHCMLSAMDAPLGHAIGNALEVQEAIATLHGMGPTDFVAVCESASLSMLHALEPGLDEKNGLERIRNAIHSGRAWEVFREWIAAQGGDIRTIDDPSLLPQAARSIDVTASHAGTVSAVHALMLGHLAMELGAGRETKEDSIDPSAGIVLHVSPGVTVQAGDVLATLFTNAPGDETPWVEQLREACPLENRPGHAAPSPILEMVGA